MHIITQLHAHPPTCAYPLSCAPAPHPIPPARPSTRHLACMHAFSHPSIAFVSASPPASRPSCILSRVCCLSVWSSCDAAASHIQPSRCNVTSYTTWSAGLTRCTPWWARGPWGVGAAAAVAWTSPTSSSLPSRVASSRWGHTTPAFPYSVLHTGYILDRRELITPCQCGGSYHGAP